MKKELFAGITISLLLIGAIANVFHIKDLSEAITSHLDLAAQACSISSYDLAESELTNALNLWLQADSYTHIFIRHSEIDSATDAFYEAISEITAKSQSCISSISKLQYHIDSIYGMEKVTLKSVF